MGFGRKKGKGKVDVVGLVVHIWAALRVLVQAMAADSDGGKKITKAEAGLIMRAVLDATDDYLSEYVID